MNKKQMTSLMNHIDKHLIHSIDLIVSIDMETKKHVHTCTQKTHIIRKMISRYKRQSKGVIEF